MPISDDKIAEVRAATDLVAVIGDTVRLKRQGATRFVGLCPFHNEKSPSFSVDAAHGLYYCFGCHRGGDVFKFVQDTEGVGFVDAVRHLAERFSVPIPEDEADDADRERATEAEALTAALRFAGKFFYRQLGTGEGAEALAYLRGRGFTDDTIKAYGLGYAPDRWDALLNASLEAGFDPDVLERAGLVIRRREKDGFYDRYRGRVMFPIFSHTGRVVGFGGRQLVDDKTQPKYVNSPETAVYQKSRVLYGLYAGRQEIRRTEEAILVEGYTDVLAMHQAGLTNAVATCGTALTPDQVQLIGRYAKRIVLLYDADNAGTGAALKGAGTVVANLGLDPDDEQATRRMGVGEVLKKGLMVYAVSLPPGDDPDSYAKTHGAEKLREYLGTHRMDFVAFARRAAERAGRLATADGQAEVTDELLDVVAALPSPLLQQTYLKRVAEEMDVPTPSLAERLEQVRRDPRRRAAAPAVADDMRRPEPSAPPAPAEIALLPPERELLVLMLEHGDPMVELVLGHMALDEFTDGPARRLAATVAEAYEEGPVERDGFLSGKYGPEAQALVARLLAARPVVSDGWAKEGANVRIDADESAKSAMTLLKTARVDAEIERQEGRVRVAAGQGTDALEAEQRRLMALHTLRREVQARAFLHGDA